MTFMKAYVMVERWRESKSTWQNLKLSVASIFAAVIILPTFDSETIDSDDLLRTTN